MGRTAIYAGSFDPITNGHVDIVERTAKLFDRVVVAIGNNPAKRYFFEMAQREDLVEQVLAHVPNVEVVPFTGLLIDTAAEVDADVIVRGLRSSEDFGSEFRYGMANRDLTGIETLFLVADPAHLFVSSSIVKEIATYGGDVSRYVPARVLAAIADKTS